MPTRALNSSEPRARTWLRNVLMLPAMALLLSGALGFVGSGFVAGLVSWVTRQDLQEIEFPLGHLKAIHVDRLQRIYAYDAAYSRIQLYDDQGRFLRGWAIPVFKGEPALKTDADNVLHLVALGRHWRLAPAGPIQDPSPFEAVANTASQSSGSYEIRSAILLPRVVKIADSEITLIRSKWQIYGLLASPLPAWLGAAAGILLLMLIGAILPEPDAKAKAQALRRSLDGLMKNLKSQ